MLKAHSPENYEEIRQIIAEFSVKIRLCFQHDNWEKLANVLADRQKYFESLQSYPLSQETCEKLKTLIQEILMQDAHDMSEIENNKNELLQHFKLLENGRRAIRAYKKR